MSSQQPLPDCATCPVCADVSIWPLLWDCPCGTTTQCRFVADGCRVCEGCMQKWFDTYGCSCVFCHQRLPRRELALGQERLSNSAPTPAPFSLHPGLKGGLRSRLNVPLWVNILLQCPAAVQACKGWSPDQVAAELASVQQAAGLASTADAATGPPNVGSACLPSLPDLHYPVQADDVATVASVFASSAAPAPDTLTTVRVSQPGEVGAEYREQVARARASAEAAEHDQTRKTLHLLLSLGDWRAAAALLQGAEGWLGPEELASLRRRVVRSRGRQQMRRREKVLHGGAPDTAQTVPASVGGAKRPLAPRHTNAERESGNRQTKQARHPSKRASTAPCKKCGGVRRRPAVDGGVCSACRSKNAVTRPPAPAKFRRAFKAANPFHAAAVAAQLKAKDRGEVIVID